MQRYSSACAGAEAQLLWLLIRMGQFQGMVMLWLVGILLFGTMLSATAEPSAIIVFGDSTVDTGNNYHKPTIPHNFQSNRYPYGYKAFDGEATGRFTEGRNIVDFIAEQAGFPVVEPFLKPDADLSRGVNFGSGGAGALPGAEKGMVLDLDEQLDNFIEYCGELSKEKNLVEYEDYLSRAVYLISIGSNDYLRFLGTPELQEAYTPEQFVGTVVSNITRATELLHSKGARKFVVFGVGPLGCLPALRILNGTGGCYDMVSALGQAHNYGLGFALERLRQMHPDSIILGTNFYDFFIERQDNFAAHGFKEPFQACCGAGPFRGRGHCGLDAELSYELCDDPSAHLWWDPYHPSQRVHQQFAEALWTGNGTAIGPINLKQLFESSLGSSLLENPGTFSYPDAAELQAS